MTQEDTLLLQSLQYDDGRAFGRLFREYAPILTHHARQVLQDEAEADDQVQLLFIDFWERQLFRQVHSSLKHYLVRIIHNRCLIHLQKIKVRDRRVNRYLEYLKYKCAADHFGQKESEEKVSQWLSILPAQRQEVFSLIHMEDKKYREAAGILDISSNSVKTHLKLAVRQLRQQLARVG